MTIRRRDRCPPGHHAWASPRSFPKNLPHRKSLGGAAGEGRGRRGHEAGRSWALAPQSHTRGTVSAGAGFSDHREGSSPLISLRLPGLTVRCTWRLGQAGRAVPQGAHWDLLPLGRKDAPLSNPMGSAEEPRTTEEGSRRLEQQTRGTSGGKEGGTLGRAPASALRQSLVVSSGKRH